MVRIVTLLCIYVSSIRLYVAQKWYEVYDLCWFYVLLTKSIVLLKLTNQVCLSSIWYETILIIITANLKEYLEFFK